MIGEVADPALAGRITLCRFFAENLLTASGGLAETVVSGGGFVHDAVEALAS